MKRLTHQFFLLLARQGNLALAMILVIGVQSLPLQAMVAPAPGMDAAASHADHMSGNDHAAMHRQMTAEQDDAGHNPHDGHEFSGCGSKICCGGACLDPVVMRRALRVIAMPLAPTAARIAPMRQHATIEHPPRLTA